MAIPDFVRQRFDTLQAASDVDRLALTECTDAKTGATCYVICAVNQAQDESQFVPLGTICVDDNPYNSFIPPEGK